MNAHCIDSVYDVIVGDVSYRYKDILNNIKYVNSKQLSHLKKNEFKVFVRVDDSLDDIKYYRHRVAMIPIDNIITRMPFRSICLYHKSEGHYDSIVDNNLFRILSEFVCKLLNNKALSVFNKFYIVPRCPYSYPDDLAKYVVECYDDEFLMNTCLFANTLHVTGASLPEISAGSIPIIGLMCKAQQDTTALSQCVEVPFFGCGIKDGKYNIYPFDSIFKDGEFFTQDEYIKKFDVLSLRKDTNIYDICYYFYQALKQLEYKMLNE